MIRFDKTKLPSYRQEAQAEMKRQSRVNTSLPSRAQLELGEALWVALRLTGAMPRNVAARQEGFRLEARTYAHTTRRPAWSLIEISYYHPSNHSGTNGSRLESILGKLQEILLPILGEKGMKLYVHTREEAWVPGPRPLESILIACLPAAALRQLRELILA